MTDVSEKMRSATAPVRGGVCLGFLNQEGGQKLNMGKLCALNQVQKRLNIVISKINDISSLCSLLPL